MNKKLTAVLLAVTLFLTACGSISGTSANTNSAPTPKNIGDILWNAQQMAQNGEGKAALQKVLPYAENNYSDGFAEFAIAYVYDIGLNDIAEAIKWYKKAARKDNPIAYYNLGNTYYKSYDYDRSYDHFNKAAKLGDADAISRVGEHYYYGEGVKRDYRKAVQYFQQAQEKGSQRADYYLALCYLESHGVPQNLEKAKALLMKAEQNGFKAATKKLNELGW